MKYMDIYQKDTRKTSNMNILRICVEVSVVGFLVVVGFGGGGGGLDDDGSGIAVGSR